MPEVVQELLVRVADEERPLTRLVGDKVTDRPAELRAGPRVALERPEAIVAVGLADGVIFVREIIGSEAPGKRLLIRPRLTTTRSRGLAASSRTPTAAVFEVLADVVHDPNIRAQVQQFCFSRQLPLSIVTRPSGRPPATISRRDAQNTRKYMRAKEAAEAAGQELVIEQEK